LSKIKKEERVTIELKITVPDPEVHELLKYLVDKTWNCNWTLDDFNYPEMSLSRSKRLLRALELGSYESLKGLGIKQ
tara:strand:- start:426 stop:656 length:231 start_codon:yes stop_codon:yes gene_type:complete